MWRRIVPSDGWTDRRSASVTVDPIALKRLERVCLARDLPLQQGLRHGGELRGIGAAEMIDEGDFFRHPIQRSAHN